MRCRRHSPALKSPLSAAVVRALALVYYPRNSRLVLMSASGSTFGVGLAMVVFAAGAGIAAVVAFFILAAHSEPGDAPSAPTTPATEEPVTAHTTLRDAALGAPGATVGETRGGEHGRRWDRSPPAHEQ